MSFLLNIINSGFGYFGIACAVTLVIFWAYGKFVAFLTKWQTRDDSFKQMSDNMPKIEATLENIKEQVQDLPNIRANLEIFLSNRVSNVAETKSPLSLNKTGETLSTEFQAAKLIDRYYQELKESVDAENPANAFDIQQISLNIARNFFSSKKDDDLLNTAKGIAYEKGVASLDVYVIFGILLRDKILEDRTLSKADVDKYDPNVT